MLGLPSICVTPMYLIGFIFVFFMCRHLLCLHVQAPTTYQWTVLQVHHEPLHSVPATCSNPDVHDNSSAASSNKSLAAQPAVNEWLWGHLIQVLCLL